MLGEKGCREDNVALSTNKDATRAKNKSATVVPTYALRGQISPPYSKSYFAAALIMVALISSVWVGGCLALRDLNCSWKEKCGE